MKVDELIDIFKYGNYEDQNIRMAVINSESKFLYMSSTLVSFYENYKEMPVYDYYKDHFPSSELDKIINGINNALEGISTSSVIVLKDSLDKEEINWDTTFLPFTSEEGDRFCVTKIQPREIQLSTTSTNYLIREIVEKSNDYFAVFDEDLIFVYISKTDQDWDIKPIVGKHISSLINGNVLEIFKDRVKKATENPGEVITDIVKLNVANRGLVYYESSMEFHDFGALGKYYLDRTAEVTEKVLRNREIESQKSAIEKMSKWTALGQMAANIAHEVNNPLAIIELQAQSISKRGADFTIEQVREKINSIKEQKDRISNIVSSLKIYSHDDRSKREHTSLSSIIHDSIALFKTATVDESLKIVFSNDSDNDMVNINSSEIIQVIINLLNNAFDAIDELSDQWIELNLFDHNGLVYLDVIDSGVGIDKEIATKIFDRFYTTKGRTKGTGLGLNICQGIINDHGGAISFDPESEYTTFRICLPQVNPS
ncbi:sensor histidine kinase [Halobacteriovorax sp.]|uniref:sensor histidine kinase n=1 Tax=Halobacteriovorax sp. TaxID=2020862 RepID=UPI003AF267DD